MKSLRALPLLLMVLCRPLPAQESRAVAITGSGGETYVLLSGMVGGVPGFARLAARLSAAGHRVIAIDPYHLSVDSTEVSFDALARRVERVMARHGVTSARLVGHAHGAGVMLRVAARAPHRVSHLYFLDVGALPANRTKVLSASLRLVPLIARVPGGRSLIRDRYIRGLRENAGRTDGLDDVTQRAYTEPMLDDIDRVIALAFRLGDAAEPEPLASVVSRIRVPATVILGDAPRESGPDSSEIVALAPLGSRLRVHRLTGIGHFPHEEAPEAVALILLARPNQTVARAAGTE
jgi:pimeloyl-ACP methyl ester carboxylesterase